LPFKIRQALIERHTTSEVAAAKGEFSLTKQAELLGISRASLYYQPVGPSEREIALKHRTSEIYTAYPFYGYRRIQAQLVSEGQAVNRKTVQR
jgi:putative transposase